MYIFIINPTAGNGRAKRIHRKLQHDKSYQKLQPVCYYTQYKGHAEELVENLHAIHEKDTIDAIVVIGGDGTMHEVVNGLKYKQISLSFVPGGSGNDFGRGAFIPKEPEQIMNYIFKFTRSLDYWLGIYDLNKKKQRLFVNCIGFGFDAVVAKSANKSFLKKIFNKLQMGTVIYLFTIIRELVFFKPFPLTIEIDQDPIRFERCFLLTINNHPYFGGGMKINPEAVNNEKEFSIMVVDSISKWKVLALFGTVFSGKHLQFKEVHTYFAKEISISSAVPVSYQVDGETGHTQYAKVMRKDTPIKVIGGTKHTKVNPVEHVEKSVK